METMNNHLNTETTTSNLSFKANSKEALNELERIAQEIIFPLGYEVVAIENGQGPKGAGRTITLYIDFAQENEQRIGLNDCMTVNQAVDELFETTPLLDGNYTLEVSSPGVERPLKKDKDFVKFSGKKVKINTFRPLEESEINNTEYLLKNSKQKNFSGILDGLTSDQKSVRLNVEGNAITIPLILISKAHLEFIFEERK